MGKSDGVRRSLLPKSLVRVVRGLAWGISSRQTLYVLRYLGIVELTTLWQTVIAIVVIY